MCHFMITILWSYYLNYHHLLRLSSHRSDGDCQWGSTACKESQASILFKLCSKWLLYKEIWHDSHATPSRTSSTDPGPNTSFNLCPIFCYTPCASTTSGIKCRTDKSWSQTWALCFPGCCSFTFTSWASSTEATHHPWCNRAVEFYSTPDDCASVAIARFHDRNTCCSCDTFTWGKVCSDGLINHPEN